jgi:hypothetical protein
LVVAAILDFSENVKMAKMAGYCLFAPGDQIELRFALRSTVSEITTIKVLVKAAILDFSENVKMAKMASWVLLISPWGPN